MIQVLLELLHDVAVLRLEGTVQAAGVAHGFTSVVLAAANRSLMPVNHIEQVAVVPRLYLPADRRDDADSGRRVRDHLAVVPLDGAAVDRFRLT